MPRSSGRLESPIWSEFKRGWQTNGDDTKIGRDTSPDMGDVVVTPEGSIVSRNGSVKLMDETAAHAISPVTMLKHFTRSNGTSEVVVAYGGVINKLNMTTGAVSNLPTPVASQSDTSSYGAEIYNDVLYMCNGINNMISYDGTTNTTITLTNVGGSTFTTNTFGFKDRKMFAVDYGDKTLLHRTKTDAGGTDIITFDYTAGDSLANAGTTRVKEGGTPLTAIEVLDNLYIYSENSIFNGDFEDIGSSTLFNLKNVSRGAGAINNASTTSIGNAMLFFDPVDRSIQQLGQRATYPGLYVSGMSDAIRNITNDVYDFSTSSAVYWKRKWLIACKSSSTQGSNDVVLVFDLESKGIFPIFGWYVSTWMVYDNRLFFGSSTSAMVFEAFVENADNNSPINWFYESNRECFGKPESYKDAGYLYVEGTIDEGVVIKCSLEFDYGKDTASKNIDGSSTEYVISDTSSGVLGVSPRGLTARGGIAKESSRIFQVWIRINNKKFQNCKVRFEADQETSGIGAASIRQFNFVNLREVSVQPPSNRIL